MNKIMDPTLAEVLHTIKSKRKIIKDSTNTVIDICDINGFVELKNGYICQIIKTEVQCLNMVYIDECGDVHISDCSVAGNFYGSTLNDENVNRYNSDEVDETNPGNRIVMYSTVNSKGGSTTRVVLNYDPKYDAKKYSNN